MRRDQVVREARRRSVAEIATLARSLLQKGQRHPFLAEGSAGELVSQPRARPCRRDDGRYGACSLVLREACHRLPYHEIQNRRPVSAALPDQCLTNESVASLQN